MLLLISSSQTQNNAALHGRNAILCGLIHSPLTNLSTGIGPFHVNLLAGIMYLVFCLMLSAFFICTGMTQRIPAFHCQALHWQPRQPLQQPQL